VGRRKRFSRCERGLQLRLIWWVMVVRGVAGLGCWGHMCPALLGLHLLCSMCDAPARTCLRAAPA
jgi:hypothetical protein